MPNDAKLKEIWDAELIKLEDLNRARTDAKFQVFEAKRVLKELEKAIKENKKSLD